MNAAKGSVRAGSALLVIDVQLDFLPGGALAIADGDAVLGPIGTLMRAREFDLIVATQDWHPPGHASFASAHPGHAPFQSITLHGRPQVLWPDHCIAGSRGAGLHPDLPWELANAIIRKGSDADVDSYSAFRNNWNASGDRPTTGLAGYLRDCGVRDVYLCGLARDFCVRWSAEDAADLGFAVHFLWDLTRPVNPADDRSVRAALSARSIDVR